MATCRDIIALALRQSGLLRPGGEMSAEEARDGLTALQTMFDAWRTGGMFGGLEDVYLTEDDTAEEGKRYYVPAGVVLTPPTSEYEDACGTTRQPRDLALYESLTSTGTLSALIYDRTQWVSILGFELTTDCPLASRGAFGLAAALATFMAPAFGGEVVPATQMLGRRFLAGLAGKVGSTQDSAGADYF